MFKAPIVPGAGTLVGDSQLQIRGRRRCGVCTTMDNLLRRYWVLFGMALAAVVLCVCGSQPLYADPYSDGGYGSCTYQQACPQTPTQTTLPSGLKIAINLTNGQTIPLSGYTITITPINGHGSSFKQATIYLDGVLTAMVTPDDTGTASWQWDTVAQPAGTVKIIVTDMNGVQTTQEFTVHIADLPAVSTSSPTGNTANPPKQTRGGSIGALLDIAGNGLQKLQQAAVNAIKALPAPLAYSFPYILFGLLGLNAALLLYQMQREIKGYHMLRSLLAREKMIAESKKTLMELVSHYLRTPITIVMGGIDMLPKDTPSAATARRLLALAQGMAQKIEGLIADTRTASEIALSGRGDTALSATALWRQPGLFLPVVLILVILLPYNYLAQHGGALNFDQVDIMAQAITFVALVIATYLLFRQLQLRRRDQREMRRLSDTQAASNHIRDELITSTATTLRTDITAIDALAGQLPPSQAIKFIRNGQDRFHDVLTKCTIAASLRGSRSQAPSVQVPLNDLLDTACKTLAGDLGAYTIHGPQANDVLTVQNPELVSYVLHTLLQNAATYSKPGSTIDVTLHHSTTSGSIIAVTDHGEGMPTAKISLLFQPFFKVEGAEKFNHEGMGFSLYLDKVIMQYLGGDITVVSQKGHGTTVTLQLP